jgi:MFS family permease
LSPLAAAWREWREALFTFSPAARRFLFATTLTWAGLGVHQVLFNLYLVEAGFDEAFVGRTVSLNAAGLALAALPAGLLADRWGRWRCLITGGLIDAIALSARASVTEPSVIFGATFLAGIGQAMIAIAAAPFLTEHSGPRERTHLFSAFFASSLLAGVLGNMIGGSTPKALLQLPDFLRPDLFHAYRFTLVLGGVIELASVVPLLALRGLREEPVRVAADGADRHATRRLVPIALNALLIGAGAGLVIPFMNLYFRSRFGCSSAQIGVFFSMAQISTAIAALVAPLLARRFGRLRTGIGFQLGSLPFLVTLGAEQRLGVAVGAFLGRATLMQASTPLIQAFIMEALPVSLRARATSLTNLVWNVGWASSAALAGTLIQRAGYAVPFYTTAVLYAIAALMFYLAFRREPDERVAPEAPPPRLPEEAKGLRGEGPMTE